MAHHPTAAPQQELVVWVHPISGLRFTYKPGTSAAARVWKMRQLARKRANS